MTPREEAEAEAKRTYEAFIYWCKGVTITIILGLFFLAWVRDDTFPKYNGEVYAPRNMERSYND